MNQIEINKIASPIFGSDGSLQAEGFGLGSGPSKFVGTILRRKDAEDIKKAVNSYDSMLEALTRLVVVCGEADALQHAGLNVPAKVWAEMYQANLQARAVIAKNT